MRITPALLALAVLGWSPTAGSAQEPEKKKDTKPAGETGISISVFSSTEKKVLSDYYTRHPAGAKPLPPGIAKNLGRGKPLPPGIAKTRLPADAQKALPTRKDGAEIVVFGDKVVLLEASGLVVDILEGVLR